MLKALVKANKVYEINNMLNEIQEKQFIGNCLNGKINKGGDKMPRRDGTGPDGNGPNTGRGRGGC